TYLERNATSFQKFLLFTSYKLHLHEQSLSITLNPHLKHILNSITPHFTKFQLKQITHLKSTYPKNIFTFLKQYKHTG
ncbi:RepB family plasmid replication initiator protein, partial [Staphylococcus epidermidis]|uniref:RepB family plasmid replication initiator protein n=1 Tax=Staphylococcus epidermidis TaxID=1282 RepID=UPI0011A1D5D2